MSKQLIPGDNSISKDNAGWILFKMPHGTFYSKATQAIADPAVNTQVIAFEYHTDLEGLIHDTVTNNSRIYVPTDGSYEIIFSGIADLNTPGPAPAHMEIFLKVNGTAVGDSNTRIHIPSTSAELPVVAAFVYDLTAGQYVELGTWGDDTDCRWLATTLTGESPSRPDCPSVVMTVKKISSKLSYE